MPVTTLDAATSERPHRWPWFLRDGRHFVYVAQVGAASGVVNKIYVGSLDSPDRTELFMSGSKAVYADGHLLFAREGMLLARPFDVARLALTLTGAAADSASAMKRCG